MRAPDDGTPTDDLVGRKAALRDVVRIRDAEFGRVRDAVSGAITAHLLASDLWANAGRVMSYLAMRSEVDLDGLWDATRGGRPVIGVPRVDPAGGTMEVCAVADPVAETWPGVFGVRSPGASAEVLDPASLDLVLVPGLAFDISGNRLGRGGGYYDRFLAGLARANPAAVAVGICWSGRVVASVPVGATDVRVGRLLTEHGVERCRG